MQDYISEIDTKRFGFKIARVDPPTPQRGTSPYIERLNELVSDLKNDGVKLIISKVDLDDLVLINKLECIGFEIKDIQVTYKYDFEKPSINVKPINSDIILREATNKDRVSLIKIAAESFNQYGHYYADKRLDQHKCTEIYKDWIERSLEDKNLADIVFVAEKENEPAGFLSFKIKKEECLYAAGVQGAVAEKFRNQNVFRLLAFKGLQWGTDLNLSWQEHNVLLTNYPVNRSFIGLGFVPFRSFVTMHGWFD